MSNGIELASIIRFSEMAGLPSLLYIFQEVRLCGPDVRLGGIA